MCSALCTTQVRGIRVEPWEDRIWPWGDEGLALGRSGFGLGEMRVWQICQMLEGVQHLMHRAGGGIRV